MFEVSYQIPFSRKYCSSVSTEAVVADEQSKFMKLPFPHNFHHSIPLFEQHRPLRLAQRDTAVGRLWPDEAPLLKALGQQAQTVTGPLQHFYHVAVSAAGAAVSTAPSGRNFAESTVSKMLDSSATVPCSSANCLRRVKT